MQTNPCIVSQVSPTAEKVPVDPPPKRTFTLDEILMDVCLAFRQPLANVLGRGQKKEVAICRKIFCYVAKEKTGCSFEVIAAHIKKRDHTTALHHHADVVGFLEVGDPEFSIRWTQYLQNSQLFTENDFQ